MRRTAIIIGLAAVIMLLTWLVIYSRRASVLVEISPDSAELVVDGESRGTNESFELKLGAGEHELVVKTDRYYEQRRLLVLEPSQEVTVSFELERILPSGGLGGQAESAPVGTVFAPLVVKGYEVLEAQYFEQNTWAAGVLDTGGGETPAVVLQKTGGGWQVVVGPGTNFSSSIRSQVPASVYNFLKENRYVSE